MRLETMQEWTERVLEGVRILFQMGQNRAFHMSYIGGRWGDAFKGTVPAA